MDTETITTTTETKVEATDDGYVTTETTTVEAPAKASCGRCECEDCRASDDELAGRLARLEEMVSGMRETKAEPTETQVKVSPEVEKERAREAPKKAAPSHASNAKRHAGMWI